MESYCGSISVELQAPQYPSPPFYKIPMRAALAYHQTGTDIPFLPHQQNADTYTKQGHRKYLPSSMPASLPQSWSFQILRSHDIQTMQFPSQVPTIYLHPDARRNHLESLRPRS